ncbi:MAG: hypothetical protein PHV61_06200 [Limnochordia bacterium]|nr:hypothetical protein [Limnochordia bacterium]MDD4517770.1 hypothetical protein [Limnochordia bacterium]
MKRRRVKLTITIIVWCVLTGLAIWGAIEKTSLNYEEPLEVMNIDGCYSSRPSRILSANRS